MVNNVTVAWATPVDAFTLGAQIEAHVESKAPVHTFRLCVKYAQASGKLLGRLPPELVENVVAYIRQPCLDNYLAEWQSAERCCLAECRASDHFDPVLLADMKCVFFSEAIVDLQMDSEDEDEDTLFEELMDENGEGHEEHCDAVESFLSMIEDKPGPKKNERFAECAKV